MHNDKPGVLIELFGHELTVLEGHAIVFGSIGFLAGVSDEISATIKKDPQYIIGTFIITFLIGEAYSRAFADVPLDPEAE